MQSYIEVQNANSDDICCESTQRGMELSKFTLSWRKFGRVHFFVGDGTKNKHLEESKCQQTRKSSFFVFLLVVLGNVLISLIPIDRQRHASNGMPATACLVVACDGLVGP